MTAYQFSSFLFECLLMHKCLYYPSFQGLVWAPRHSSRDFRLIGEESKHIFLAIGISLSCWELCWAKKKKKTKRQKKKRNVNIDRRPALLRSERRPRFFCVKRLASDMYRDFPRLGIRLETFFFRCQFFFLLMILPLHPYQVYFSPLYRLFRRKGRRNWRCYWKIVSRSMFWGTKMPL